MNSIYHYLNYRDFLGDYFKEQKEKKRSFSHQFFARKAGIKSSGFVLHVIKGERNLTKPVLLKISRAIGLNPKETEYFEDLVSFDQARNQSDKEFYLARITDKRKSVNVKELEDRQYEFYTEWYHTVIRELLTLVKDNSNPLELAKYLIPSVTPAKVKKSLELMEGLGIIKKEKGVYKQADPFITGGGPFRNTAIVNFQKQMLNMGTEAWDRFGNKEITMNTVTLCMSEKLVETMKQEVRKFKKKLYKLVESDENNPDRVYHLNLDLFPMSKTVQKG
jgi:uncharacterized protein (TIGR02147 family)